MSKTKTLLEAAKSEALAGRRQEALRIVNSILVGAPDTLDALRFKGNVIELDVFDEERNSSEKFVRSDRIQEAATCYERILAIDPSNVLALVDLGTHWKNRGDFHKALDYFDRALLLLKGGSFGQSWQDEFDEAMNGKNEIARELHEASDKQAANKRGQGRFNSKP
jgi:tetratricopeptide (TPR) repeat protein